MRIIVTAENMHFGYATPLLASFTFHPGVNVIYGPSGIGKTTFLNALIGANKYHADDVVRFFDTHSKEDVDVLDNVAYARQETLLLPAYSLRENLLLVNKLDTRLLYRMAAQFGIKECLDSKPYEVSVGQAHRAYVLRALCSNRPVVLLDEPYAALGGITVNDMHTSIEKFAQTHGKTIIMASHKQVDGVSYEMAPSQTNWIRQ
jgi:ABC-type nitrate/sulfonate/bicarbonate transport system ATPase subunit